MVVKAVGRNAAGAAKQAAYRAAKKTGETVAKGTAKKAVASGAKKAASNAISGRDMTELLREGVSAATSAPSSMGDLGVLGARKLAKQAKGEVGSMTQKTVRNTAERLFNSSYIKETVTPGMKDAFAQAGGKSGMAKRVLGSAAVGGATTGTIGALRGDDFWESSKSGVLMGGAAGMGLQGRAMGKTEAGVNLRSSVKGQYGAAKGDAAREQAGIDASLTKGYTESQRGDIAEAQYRGQSFWQNMRQDRKNVNPAAESRYNQLARNPDAPMSERIQRPGNVSNQVHTRKRLEGVQQGSNNVLDGNTAGGGRYFNI